MVSFYSKVLVMSFTGVLLECQEISGRENETFRKSQCQWKLTRSVPQNIRSFSFTTTEMKCIWMYVNGVNFLFVSRDVGRFTILDFWKLVNLKKITEMLRITGMHHWNMKSLPL